MGVWVPGACHSSKPQWRARLRRIVTWWVLTTRQRELVLRAPFMSSWSRLAGSKWFLRHCHFISKPLSLLLFFLHLTAAWHAFLSLYQEPWVMSRLMLYLPLQKWVHSLMEIIFSPPNLTVTQNTDTSLRCMWKEAGARVGSKIWPIWHPVDPLPL